MAGLCWLRDHDFEVINVESFDYQRFVAEGESYLHARYGAEIAREQIKYSDIAKEIDLIPIFIKKVRLEDRLPEIKEIISLLEHGYLVAANVNARSLNGKSGYVGHFVVIKGCSDEGLIIHGPGKPPEANRRITFPQFLKGWDYPDKKSRNIVAVRKITNG